MLISRGLRTLFLGFAVSATVLDRHSPRGAASQVQISRGLAPETRDVADELTGHDRADRPRVAQDEHNNPAIAQPLRSRSRGGSRWRKLRARQNGTSCEQYNGTALDCSPNPTNLPAAAAAATVFVTKTRTNTITVLTGSPTTALVTSTNTIVITLLNPTEQTQVATVTATSFFRGSERSVGNTLQAGVEGVTESLTRDEEQLGVEVEKRQDQTITSTITAEVFTTVLQQSTLLATLTNTVFSTKLVAPNAVTTVFVTTTIFLPSGAIPSTAPPTAAPTSPSAPGVPTTSASISTAPATTIAPPSSSISTSASLSSIPPSSSTLPSSTTESMTMTMETMMTSTVPTTTSSAAPTPSMTPMIIPSMGFTPTQIVGIAIGSLLGLILLILLAFGLRRVIRRRRAIQAQMRQQLTPPEVGGPTAAAAAAVAPRRGGPRGGAAIARRDVSGGTGLATAGSSNSAGGNSANSGPSAHSMLTGEGEVRIVIRPAPKRRTQSSQLWPMPPGHRGQTYSLFVEGETTTGETTPQDPTNWSIASERGSVKDGSSNNNNGKGGNTTIYSTLDPGYTGPPGSGSGPSGSGSGGISGLERGSLSGGRPSTSIFSAGWDRETSMGGRSELSYPGVGTLLTPPPAWHGTATERGWLSAATDPANIPSDDSDRGQRAGETSSSPNTGAGGYQMGSLGIGKAW